jgi:hypothetical protein
MTTETKVSGLSGEFAQGQDLDIPFAGSFDASAVKAIDPDPMYVVVKIKEGRGSQGAGPHYGAEILEDLEKQIISKQPPGFKGHPDTDKIGFQFDEPQTIWVGAKFLPDSNELAVKGYIPPTAPALRSQLQLAGAGAASVNSVSIFGQREVDGDKVSAFDLWSIDWTPKGRAGMETELVSVSGEQGADMSKDEVLKGLTVAEVPAPLVGEIAAHAVAESTESKVIGEMKVILDLEDADAEAILDAVKAIVGDTKNTELEATVMEMVTADDKIKGEMAQAAVFDIVKTRVTPESTEEEITGEIATALKLPYVNALNTGKTNPVVTGGGRSDAGKTDTRSHTKWS